VKARRVYAGVPAEERRHERRERLLAAGLRHFGTIGYAASTIPGLCAAARVTARHFYEAFPGREALFVCVYDRVIERTRAAVLAAAAQAPADPAAQIRAGVAAFVHSYVDDPRHVRIACIECVGISPAVEAHRRSVMHMFARIIEERAEALSLAGQVPARDHSLGSLALAGATNELLVEWAARTVKPAAATIIDELVRLYLGAITAGK
jgi:AcrR family transcriptional regulator